MNIDDRVKIDGEKVYVSTGGDVFKGIWVKSAGEAPPDVVANFIKSAFANAEKKQSAEIERLREALEDISELDHTADETALSAVHMADAALRPETHNYLQELKQTSVYEPREQTMDEGLKEIADIGQEIETSPIEQSETLEIHQGDARTHVAACSDDNCERCEIILENYCGCDECGYLMHNDSSCPGTLMPDGRTLCDTCLKTSPIEQSQEPSE